MTQRAQIWCSVTTSRGAIGWKVGGRFKEGTYVYLWLIHVDIWLKPTQYCKAINLQLKVNKFKKRKNNYPIQNIIKVIFYVLS